MEQIFSEVKSLNQLPEKFTRNLDNRIFVNRPLNMNKIKFVGFDMDYTLAVYKTPVYEKMVFQLILNDLIDSKGLPKEALQNLKYDPNFPIKGIVLDKRFGNFLKIDQFGKIIKGTHGTVPLSKQQIKEIYPHCCIFKAYQHGPLLPINNIEGERFKIMTTYTDLVKISLLSQLIDFFDSKFKYNFMKTNNDNNDNNNNNIDNSKTIKTKKIKYKKISFYSLFEDVEMSHKTVDDLLFLHKPNPDNQVIKNKGKYIHQNEKLRKLLISLKTIGKKKLFLLTNSNWRYTMEVMPYVLGKDGKEDKNWIDLFDIIITSANKPKFFQIGNVIRKVDLKKGILSLTQIDDYDDLLTSSFSPSSSPDSPYLDSPYLINNKNKNENKFIKGKIYHGGNYELFKRWTKTKGEECLYIGDNILHDIVSTKKERCLWRTLYIFREIKDHIQIEKENYHNYLKLLSLEYKRAEMFKNLNCLSQIHDIKNNENEKEKENGNNEEEFNNFDFKKVSNIKESIEKLNHEIDSKFNKYFGSLLRTGHSNTLFTSNLKKYADLYTDNLTNFFHYPTFYYFSPIHINQELPHEIALLQNKSQ